MFEADLEKALMLSTLEYEEQKKVYFPSDVCFIVKWHLYTFYAWEKSFHKYTGFSLHWHLYGVLH